MEKVQVLRNKTVTIQEVVDVWKTEDGRQFDTKAEATANEKFIAIKAKFNRIPSLEVVIIDATFSVMYLRGEADISTIAQYYGAKKTDSDVEKFPCYALVRCVTEYTNFGSDYDLVTIMYFDSELSKLSQFLSTNAGA